MWPLPHPPSIGAFKGHPSKKQQPDDRFRDERVNGRALRGIGREQGQDPKRVVDADLGRTRRVGGRKNPKKRCREAETAIDGHRPTPIRQFAARGKGESDEMRRIMVMMTSFERQTEDLIEGDPVEVPLHSVESTAEMVDQCTIRYAIARTYEVNVPGGHAESLQDSQALRVPDRRCRAERSTVGQIHAIHARTGSNLFENARGCGDLIILMREHEEHAPAGRHR